MSNHMSPALWVIPWPYQRFPPEQFSLPAPSRAVHPPTRAAPFVLHRPVTNKQLDPPCHIHTSSEMPCKTACISLPPLETTPFAPSSPTGPSAEIEPDNGDWTSSGYDRKHRPGTTEVFEGRDEIPRAPDDPSAANDATVIHSAPHPRSEEGEP